jgi:kumamolisin
VKSSRDLSFLAVMILALGLPMASAAPIASDQVDKITRVARDSERVEFALTLPLRNQADIQGLIKDLYSPGSPSFRKFLSVAEFQERFAPRQSDYQSLKSFARSAGLTVVREPPGRTALDVSGDVATVRRLFKTQIYWRRAGDGSEYIWADKEPAPPSILTGMGGNAAMLRQRPPQPLIRIRASSNAPPAPNSGTGPYGTYVPSDIRTAYNLNSIQNGGTPVALYELSSANYADAAVYASEFNLPSPTITNTNVDGGGSENSPAEVMLDIDMVMAVSSPTTIYVYTGNSAGTAPLDTFLQIADDNLVGQVSSSWSLGCESDVGASTLSAENTVFTQMVMQGMAVFIALGDYGAYNTSLAGCVAGELQLLDPGSQPMVTSAGGTSLTTDSQQQYVSEVVWNDLSNPQVQGATGGGVSAYWSIPTYQSGITVDDTQFSTSMRNAPDFSLNADPLTGYYCYCSTSNCWSSGVSGWFAGIGGTSAVAPQLAAFWSLVSNGLGQRAGFANPTLYALYGQSKAYTANYHDITSGNNGYYDAFSLYDNASGIGSYNGASLYDAVVSPGGTTKGSASALVPIITFLL